MCSGNLTRWQHSKIYESQQASNSGLCYNLVEEYNNSFFHLVLLCVWVCVCLWEKMAQNEQPTGVGLWFGVLDVGWELGEDVISSCVRLSLLGGQFGIPEQTGGRRQETQSERQWDQAIWKALTPGLELSSDWKHVTHSHRVGRLPLKLSHTKVHL